MTRGFSRDLIREAAVFSRYLLGESAPPLLIRRYAEAHCGASAAAFLPGSRFEVWQVQVARRGVICCAVSEAYASRFTKNTLLRRKLVLVLALLECLPASSARLSRPRSRGLFRSLLNGVWSVSSHLVLVGFGVLIHLVPHLFFHREPQTRL